MEVVVPRAVGRLGELGILSILIEEGVINFNGLRLLLKHEGKDGSTEAHEAHLYYLLRNYNNKF